MLKMWKNTNTLDDLADDLPFTGNKEEAEPKGIKVAFPSPLGKISQGRPGLGRSPLSRDGKN